MTSTRPPFSTHSLAEENHWRELAKTDPAAVVRALDISQRPASQNPDIMAVISAVHHAVADYKMIPNEQPETWDALVEAGVVDSICQYIIGVDDVVEVDVLEIIHSPQGLTHDFNLFIVCRKKRRG